MEDLWRGLRQPKMQKIGGKKKGFILRLPFGEDFGNRRHKVLGNEEWSSTFGKPSVSSSTTKDLGFDQEICDVRLRKTLGWWFDCWSGWTNLRLTWQMEIKIHERLWWSFKTKVWWRLGECSISGSAVEEGMGTLGLSWRKESWSWGNFDRYSIVSSTAE